jgi:hypothetical protein
MMPRLQFTFRALLVAMLLPPAGYWFLRSRQAALAAHDYRHRTALYDVRKEKFQEVYDSSRRLQDAELAVPFADRRAARIGYLNRLAHLEDCEEGRLYYRGSPRGAPDLLKDRIGALAAERRVLEQELGMKADRKPMGTIEL